MFFEKVSEFLLNVLRSICQKTSWSALQVTRELLDLFVSEHDISDSFWDIPSCFYHRNDDVEINFCLPVTVDRIGSSIGIDRCRRHCYWGLLLTKHKKYVIQSATPSSSLVAGHGLFARQAFTIDSIHRPARPSRSYLARHQTR